MDLLILFFFITAPLLILTAITIIINPDNARKNEWFMRSVAFLYFSKDPRKDESLTLTNKQIYIYTATAIITGLVEIVVGIYWYTH